METATIYSLRHRKRISQFPVIFFICVLAVCPLWGQGVPLKKTMTSNDFSMWHTLRFSQISGDGTWISYQMEYEQAQDTLVMLNSHNKSQYKFPDGYGGQFQPSDSPTTFTFKDNQKRIGVLNLKTGETLWDAKAKRFKYSRNGKYLALYNFKSQNGYLKLIDNERNKTNTIKGVKDFKFDPSGERALLITSDSIKGTHVSLIRLSDMQKTVIISNDHSKFQYPTWNKNGNGVVFMESDRNSKQRLYYFENGETPMLKKLDDIDLKGIGDVEISKLNLSLSRDGERVFFWTHRVDDTLKKDEEEGNVDVQVWKGTDKWIYPRQKLDWEFQKADKLAVWWPHTKRVFQIGTTEHPEVILTGNQKFALSYNLLTYEPQYRQYPQSDFYITNLETGNRSLFVKGLETALGYLSIDPNGKYIAYFKDDNWWMYDVKKKEHSNSSIKIQFPLTYQYAPHSVDITPFGSMGWTDNSEFLIYDKFDIWKIDADNIPPKRLTNGRDRSIQYRKYKGLNDTYYSLYETGSNPIYNLTDQIIFTTRDTLYNFGYAVKEPNAKIAPLLNETGRITKLRKAKFTNCYIYTKEKNSTPPALYKTTGKTSKRLVQSNSHQDVFGIGKTELITYKNDKGQNLNGLLHYPDNYEEGKKYPMIVYIYELTSNTYQKFQNPSFYNGNGFNYRNYTTAGYFVLEPDILIQKGNPGVSATDCVVRAVNTVLEKGSVNKNALGLIGHSFGGYETTFIISQTDMFASAVVGAGIFDLTSSYHNINRDNGRPEHWHYENQQWQMGKSFYEGKELYKRNSPVEYAQNIKTPTLIWTGNKDYHVNWHQSEAMYLALRRLNVVVELLVYEDEIHSLLQAKNQKDLTKRIFNWFEKYLKAKPKSDI